MKSRMFNRPPARKATFPTQGHVSKMPTSFLAPNPKGAPNVPWPWPSAFGGLKRTPEGGIMKDLAVARKQKARDFEAEWAALLAAEADEVRQFQKDWPLYVAECEAAEVGNSAEVKVEPKLWAIDPRVPNGRPKEPTAPELITKESVLTFKEQVEKLAEADVKAAFDNAESDAEAFATAYPHGRKYRRGDPKLAKPTQAQKRAAFLAAREKLAELNAKLAEVPLAWQGQRRGLLRAIRDAEAAVSKADYRTESWRRTDKTTVRTVNAVKRQPWWDLPEAQLEVAAEAAVDFGQVFEIDIAAAGLQEACISFATKYGMSFQEMSEIGVLSIEVEHLQTELAGGDVATHTRFGIKRFEKGAERKRFTFHQEGGSLTGALLVFAAQHGVQL